MQVHPEMFGMAFICSLYVKRECCEVEAGLPAWHKGMYHQKDLKSSSGPLKDHKWEANSKCVNSTWQGNPVLILPSISEYWLDCELQLRHLNIKTKHC